MAFVTTRVVKMATTIRNNWKKSLFFSTAGLYLSSILIERNRINNMMKLYCLEASKIGEQFLKPTVQPHHVTVILNPAAKKKKSKKDYENYVEPILHCAGLKVSLIQTETEGQERDLMNIMHNTDSVIIAGGSGSLHDAITGMLRRTDGVQYPIGVIPLGTKNVSSRLIHGEINDGKYSKSFREVRQIADATLAVVKNVTKDIDILKIESLEREKVVYSVSGFTFGTLRDIIAKCEAYWYFGNKAKPYLAMISNTLFRKFNELRIKSDLIIDYSLPCTGCSNCIERSPRQVSLNQTVTETAVKTKRWWSSFTPKSKATVQVPIEKEEKPSEKKIDYSTIVNESCGKMIKLEKGEDKFVNVSLISDPNDCKSNLVLHEVPNLTKGQFVLDGVSLRNGKLESKEFIERTNEVTKVELQDLQILVKPDDSKVNKYFEVDGEEYELENVLVKRLPKRITVFSPKKNKNE